MLKLFVAIQAMVSHIDQSIVSRIDDERGATATEYAVLIGVVTLVLLAGVRVFFTSLVNFFQTVAARLPLT